MAASTLQVAPVPIIAKKDCAADGVYPSRLTESMFCAGRLETGGVDGCQGEVGVNGVPEGTEPTLEGQNKKGKKRTKGRKDARKRNECRERERGRRTFPLDSQNLICIWQ